MSTFAVFGMTEPFARSEAEKKIEPCNSARRPKTLAEFTADMERYVENLMASKRSSRVSPLFDAPQFCHDFIKTMRDCNVRHRDIRIRYQTKERTDNPKRPYKLVWKDYHEK